MLSDSIVNLLDKLDIRCIHRYNPLIHDGLLWLVFSSGVYYFAYSIGMHQSYINISPMLIHIVGILGSWDQSVQFDLYNFNYQSVT